MNNEFNLSVVEFKLRIETNVLEALVKALATVNDADNAEKMVRLINKSMDKITGFRGDLFKV